jgi:hypothetical protein
LQQQQELATFHPRAQAPRGFVKPSTIPTIITVNRQETVDKFSLHSASCNEAVVNIRIHDIIFSRPAADKLLWPFAKLTLSRTIIKKYSTSDNNREIKKQHGIFCHQQCLHKEGGHDVVAQDY